MKKLLFASAVAFVGMTGMAAAATLDDVRAKGFVQCGVSTGLVGFAGREDVDDVVRPDHREDQVYCPGIG